MELKTPKTLANFSSVESDGATLPLSIRLYRMLLIESLSATSSCDKPRSSLNFLILSPNIIVIIV